tara:strand:+ start:4599 stop:4979 length:381 start_codon:yes stop_codon:yes gene_type:complete
MRLIYFIIIISLSLHSQNEIKSIDFDEYSSLSKSIDFLIVDVRTPEEYKISRINNSININFYDEKFINMFKKIDYDKHVLIYCRSGRRSLEAAKILTDEGFGKIYDLKGGILALDKLNIDFSSLDD